MSSRKPPEHFIDGMIISDWDRDLILRCLNNYRVANAGGKNPLSLNIFLTRLLLSGLTDQGYTEDGNPNFKEEALRRFVNGKSRLEDDKVFAVQQYLIHKKFLREEELGGDIDPDYLPGLLALHDYLGNKSEEAVTYLSQIKNTYFTIIDGFINKQTIELRIILKKSDVFFRVEEHCEITSKDLVSHDVHKKDAAETGQPKRRGYGFVSTGNHIIYIFVNDHTWSDHITYVQTELYPDINSTYELTFMRSGDLVPLVINSSVEWNPPIILNNVFRFSSDPATTKVHKEHLFLMTTERQR